MCKWFTRIYSSRNNSLNVCKINEFGIIIGRLLYNKNGKTCLLLTLKRSLNFFKVKKFKETLLG